MNLREIASDPDLMEVARKAIEEQLIEFRDAGIGVLGRNNGLVCKGRDGSLSSIIRMGPEDAVNVGLKAIADYLDKNSR